MRRFIDRPSVPPSVKRAAKQGLALYRMLTSPIRLLPDFIIIGAQKCGTTCLYLNLAQHPGVAPASRSIVHGSEVQFFSVNFAKGIAWYRAHFPTSLYEHYVRQTRKQDFVTGEKSPYYIFHPAAPKRISEAIPQVKLIALLRNPVDRAYSHYHHNVRRGRETLSFEEAIQREAERLSGERERILGDENYYSFNHQHYSYLSRGIYVDQLRILMCSFPKHQILILGSEDFFADTPTAYRRVLEFLDLPSWEPKGYKRKQLFSYPSMDPSTRKRLTDYFEPHNQRLYEYLGTDFAWDR